jgi:hypothetical protein
MKSVDFCWDCISPALDKTLKGAIKIHGVNNDPRMEALALSCMPSTRPVDGDIPYKVYKIFSGTCQKCKQSAGLGNNGILSTDITLTLYPKTSQ